MKSYHLGGEHDNGMQEKRGLKSLFSMKSDGPTRAYRRPRKNGDPNEGYGGDDGKW